MEKHINACRLRKARPSELQSLIAIDDEASTLYAEAGLNIDLENDHAFAVAESLRWAKAIDQGLAYVATNGTDKAIGFISLCFIGKHYYLDQLSVRRTNMRQGVGTKLLKQAIAWSKDKPLWLTTYAHIPWNKCYYEKHGFAHVPESLCDVKLCEMLEEQRLALPAPEHRIAMARMPSS